MTELEKVIAGVLSELLGLIKGILELSPESGVAGLVDGELGLPVGRPVIDGGRRLGSVGTRGQDRGRLLACDERRGSGSGGQSQGGDDVAEHGGW